MTDPHTHLKVHPLPPDTLSLRPLPLVALQTIWWRSYPCQSDPLAFDDQAAHRFNAPAGEYSVLYLGSDAPCVFVETFDDPACIAIPYAQVAQRCLCTLTTTRPLQLVDLTGPGLRTLGADARLCTGDYGVTRQWSLAFWHHPARPDGLYYLSRNDPSRRNVVLFDRAADTLTLTKRFSLQEPDSQPLLTEILATYAIRLCDDARS